MFEIAAGYEAPVFVHLRSSAAFAHGGALAPFQEVIANAAATGAALHIVHMNSTAGERAEEALAMIRGARDRGVDVTTEAYPVHGQRVAHRVAPVRRVGRPPTRRLWDVAMGRYG